LPSLFSSNSLQEVRSGSTVKAKYQYAADGTKLKVEDKNSKNGYDYLGSVTLVKNTNTITPEVAFAEGVIRPNDITYFEKDHLGSVRVTLNHSGSVTGRNDYYPFGMRHTGGLVNQNNRYLFNGKEDQVTGGLNLLDYGARMYNPEIGRWFVPEPLSELYYGQGRYNYCLNNPVKYIDPFGLWTKDGNDSHTDDPEEIARFMSYGASASKKGATINDYTNFVDWEMSGGYAATEGNYTDGTGSYMLSPPIVITRDKSGKGTWTNRDDVYNALNPSRFIENPLVTAIHEGQRAFWRNAAVIGAQSMTVIGTALTFTGIGAGAGLALINVGGAISYLGSMTSNMINISNGHISQGIGNIVFDTLFWQGRGAIFKYMYNTTGAGYAVGTDLIFGSGEFLIHAAIDASKK